MRRDDLLVHVHARKLPCVLDPALVLGSPYGLALALRSTWVMEPWLTRAFWQLIDASELVMPQLAKERGEDMLLPQGEVLMAWIALRDNTDAGSWPFRWVGDRLAESQLKDHADGGLIGRYEALAERLTARWEAPRGDVPDTWPVLWNPMQASIDTLALSAALDAAIVLTAQAEEAAPWPVQALGRIGIATELLDPLPEQSLFAAERALLREALAAAGLSSVASRLPRLAVLHVMAGDADYFARSIGTAMCGGEDAEGPRPQGSDPWQDARAWWYLV